MSTFRLELKQFPRNKEYPTFGTSISDPSEYFENPNRALQKGGNFSMHVNSTTNVFFICLKEKIVEYRSLSSCQTSGYFYSSPSPPATSITSYLFKVKINYSKILSACLTKPVIRLSITYVLPTKTLYAELYFRQRGGNELYLINFKYRIVVEV